MMSHGHAMRALAEKYLRLAKTSHNPSERTKFIDYATLYAQLSEQARRRNASTLKAAPIDLEDPNVPRRYASRR